MPMMAKTMDSLSRDSCAALAAGMSYGKYMATKITEPQLATKEITGVNPPGLSGQQARPYCIRCGKLIPSDTKQRLYCGTTCRNLTSAERAHEKYLKKIGSRGPMGRACPVCGTEFATTDRRKATCSPICAKAARSERMRKYQEQKRAKEKAEYGI